MRIQRFFAELKRRNVYRVAIAYCVVAWLVIQIATQVLPFFDVPNWGVRLVVLFVVFGFPFALIFAWAFELTPEGIRRTADIPPDQSMTHATGRKLNFIIIGLLLTVIAFLIFFRQRTTNPIANISPKSIAVLPFENLSEEKSNEYFAEGIQDEILTRLGKIADLKVISRTSTQRYRGTIPNLSAVANQLGVANFLIGSVQRAADRVQINVQLIDAVTDRTRWGETYARKLIDVFEVESEVAQRVAEALDARLSGHEQAQVKTWPTTNEAAHDAYLRGRYFLNKRTPESLRRGLALFREAVARDPQFALGHAGIADAYILLGKIGEMPGDAAAKEAWPEVSSALFIDDQLAEGYISRAILLNDFEWDWAAAEKDYRKANELNPNSAYAHNWYARSLAQRGRADEALREIEAAQKLDPLAPTIRASKAKIFLAAGKSQEAVVAAQEALELEANFANGLQILGEACSLLGDSGKAIAAAKKFVEVSDGSGWAELELAYAYAVANKKEECNQLVHEATARADQFSPYDMATISTALDDKEGAFHWLEQAINARSVDVIWIRVDPRLAKVKDEPEFKKLVAQMVPRRQKLPNE